MLRSAPLTTTLRELNRCARRTLVSNGVQLLHDGVAADLGDRRAGTGCGR